MVSQIAEAATAADVYAGSPVGAFLPLSIGAVPADAMGAVKFVRRPRPVPAADALGQRCNGAGQSVVIGSDPAIGRQIPSEQHPQVTPAAAASSGGVGPHPARDPV
jgi:hypothetical protein